MTFIVTLALSDCIVVAADSRVTIEDPSSGAPLKYCDIGRKSVRSDALGFCLAAQNNASLASSTPGDDSQMLTYELLSYYIISLEQQYKGRTAVFKVEQLLDDLYQGSFLSTPSISKYSTCFRNQVILFVAGYRQDKKPYIARWDKSNNYAESSTVPDCLTTDDDFIKEKYGSELTGLSKDNAYGWCYKLMNAYLRFQRGRFPPYGLDYYIGGSLDLCKIVPYTPVGKVTWYVDPAKPTYKNHADFILKAASLWK